MNITDVITAHTFEGDGFCRCQKWNTFEDEMGGHEAHIAEAVTDAGYGSIRLAMEAGWDAAVAAMQYPDGTPVELMTNNNPYRQENR